MKPFSLLLFDNSLSSGIFSDYPTYLWSELSRLSMVRLYSALNQCQTKVVSLEKTFCIPKDLYAPYSFINAEVLSRTPYEELSKATNYNK